jgi:hypothetical protein
MMGRKSGDPERQAHKEVKMTHRCVLAALFLLPAHAALAFEDSGDNISQLVLESLQVPKTTLVSLAEATVRISSKQVQVDYVFRNASESTISSVVTFQMPDVEGPYVNIDAGDTATKNFLGFTATEDGAEVKPELQQRVYSTGLDQTVTLIDSKVALNPLSEAAKADVQALPQAIVDKWLSLGLLVEDPSETSDDGKKVYAPTWTMKSTYSWIVAFPPGKDVHITTVHANSIGSSVAFGLSADAGPDDPALKSMQERYCVDDAIIKAAKELREGQSAFNASWSSFKLNAGSAWSPGIGTFRLIVERSSPSSLISVCGAGEKKSDPTSIEMTFRDFTPDRAIEVLYLDPAEAP